MEAVLLSGKNALPVIDTLISIYKNSKDKIEISKMLDEIGYMENVSYVTDQLQIPLSYVSFSDITVSDYPVATRPITLNGIDAVNQASQISGLSYDEVILGSIDPLGSYHLHGTLADHKIVTYQESMK